MCKPSRASFPVTVTTPMRVSIIKHVVTLQSALFWAALAALLQALCADCFEPVCPFLVPPPAVPVLQDLFSPFGPISRVYIAYDRDTGENRGFAFVNFVYR